MQATADVLAMASLEVDLSKIEVGQTITVKWRGKPVFIRRRSEDEIHTAEGVNLSTLRDPQKDADRVTNPEVSCDSQDPQPAWSQRWPAVHADHMMLRPDKQPMSKVAFVEAASDHLGVGIRSCLSGLFTAGSDGSDVSSGWWSSACARTWAACHYQVQGTTEAGSAHVTAATTMCQVVRVRGQRPLTWRCRSTSSLTTTRSWSARCVHIARSWLLGKPCQTAQPQS